jgi:hypothetical protein
MTEEQQREIAEILWARLVDAFNAEAEIYRATYDEKNGFGESSLGSIGSVKNREVMRSAWWNELGGEELIGGFRENRQFIELGVPDDGKFDDYWEITHLIEDAHYGEQLATGRITFGS